MEFLNIVILGLVSFLVLFILSRIMGYRAISELSFFDYVVAITIGSIAAEMSTNIDMEWWKGVTAMVIYALLDIIFTVISQKSTAARLIITGSPIVLIYQGKIYKRNLRKARIELNDLLTSASELINRVKSQEKDIKNIFLGVMDSNGVLTLFDK